MNEKATIDDLLTQVDQVTFHYGDTALVRMGKSYLVTSGHSCIYSGEDEADAVAIFRQEMAKWDTIRAAMLAAPVDRRWEVYAQRFSSNFHK